MEGQRVVKSIYETFGFDRFSVFAITGGGGKTSLMYAMGRFLSESKKTLLSTTAKIFPPRGLCAITFVGPANECAARLNELPPHSLMTAAKDRTEEKLIGYAPEEIDQIASECAADKIIVEADGSRGLPVKAYESWEPPVPRSSQCQIVVAGADALARPISGAVAFRLDLLSERYGIKKGEYLSAANFAAILSSRCEYLKNSPDDAFRLLLINKGELLSGTSLDEVAKCMADSLKGYDALAVASIKEDEVYNLIRLTRG